MATGVAQAHKSPYPTSAEYAAPAWFVDVAAQAGLSMLNVNGGIDTKKYIIETTGSGVALLDMTGMAGPISSWSTVPRKGLVASPSRVVQ